MIKNLDSFNDSLSESQKKFNLKLINDRCRRLAYLSSSLNFSENKQDFDIYLKFIQDELIFIREIENDIINLKDN